MREIRPKKSRKSELDMNGLFLSSTVANTIGGVMISPQHIKSLTHGCPRFFDKRNQIMKLAAKRPVK